MQWLYILIIVVGVIILASSLFPLKSKGKNKALSIIIAVLGVVMLVLSALAFLIG